MSLIVLYQNINEIIDSTDTARAMQILSAYSAVTLLWLQDMVSKFPGLSEPG
jgi:hypothetical protein